MRRICSAYLYMHIALNEDSNQNLFMKRFSVDKLDWERFVLLRRLIAAYVNTRLFEIWWGIPGGFWSPWVSRSQFMGCGVGGKSVKTGDLEPEMACCRKSIEAILKRKEKIGPERVLIMAKKGR